jgi:hypothetical protein
MPHSVAILHHDPILSYLRTSGDTIWLDTTMELSWMSEFTGLRLEHFIMIWILRRMEGSIYNFRMDPRDPVIPPPINPRRFPRCDA